MSLADVTKGLLLGYLSYSPSFRGSCATAPRLACACSTRAYSMGISHAVPGPADDEAPGSSEDLENSAIRQGPSLTHVDRSAVLPHAHTAACTADTVPANRCQCPCRSGQASVVDMGNKGDTMRVATASSRVLLGQEAFALVRDNKMAKGDVLPTAELAGDRVSALPPNMMAAWRACLKTPTRHAGR